MSKVHDKQHKLKQNDIKVYNVIKRHKQAVCIEDNRNIIYKRKITVGEYKHTTATINKALEDAVDYCYNRIVNNY